MADHIRPVYPGMPDAEFFDPVEPPRKLQAAQHRQGRRRPPGTRNGGPHGARAEPPALCPVTRYDKGYR